MITLALLSFLFISLTHCFVPEQLLALMEPEVRKQAELIPVEAGLIQYKDEFMITLKWSVDNKNDELTGYLLAEASHSSLESLFLDIIEKDDGESFDILAPLCMSLIQEQSLIDAVRLVLGVSRNKKMNYHILKVLLRNNYSPQNLHAIENYLITAMYNEKRFDDILKIMIEHGGFPVMLERKAMSSNWYDLLRSFIRNSEFVSFRRIVGDWERFKYGVDLSDMAGPGSQRLLDGDERRLSLIEEAIYYDDRRSAFLWFLVGRTWLFSSLRCPNVRKSQTVKELFALIPELDEVPWDNKDIPVRQLLSNFLATVYETRPNCINAQTGILCSTALNISIEEYIKDAIKGESIPRVQAAAWSGRLKTEHVHLVYAAGKKMEDAHFFINIVVEDCDPATLQYGTKGLVLVLFAQRHTIFNRRALRLFELLFTNLGKTDIIKVFKTLDRIFRLNELEETTYRELLSTSRSRAVAFSTAPRDFTNSEDAFDLLAYYNDTRKFTLIPEFVHGASTDVLLGCFEGAIDVSDFSLAFRITKILMIRDLTDFQKDQIYETFKRSAILKGNIAIVHKLIITTVFKQDLREEFVMAAATKNDEAFFNFLLDEMKPGSIKVKLISDLLHYSLTSRPHLFDRLWKFVNSDYSYLKLELEAFCIKKIIENDLTEGTTNIMKTIMSGKHVQELSGLVALMKEAKRFDLITVVLQSTYALEVNWTLNGNHIFEDALNCDHYECCRLLLRDFEVFKAAMKTKSIAFKAMFPLLAEEEATEFTSIQFLHRRYIRLNY